MNDSEKEIDYKTGYGCVTIALSVVATACSFAALSTVDINKNVKASESITITVLGTIVTLLVAWQIWITISSREEVKEARKAIEEIKELRSDLETTKTLFTQRNLEIQLLIDAHAKLLNVDEKADLSYQYLNYGEALELLILSNVDLSYEQINNAINGLGDVLMTFFNTKNPTIAWDFIDNKKQFERQYQNIMNALAKRENDIDKFRQRITRMRDIRNDYIKTVNESNIGKRIQKMKQKLNETKQKLIDDATADARGGRGKC